MIDTLQETEQELSKNGLEIDISNGYYIEEEEEWDRIQDTLIQVKETLSSNIDLLDE